jgi:hypothetical protein
VTDDIVRRLRDVDHPVSADFRIEAAAEIERLRSNVGCARNQGTTQFCHEALDAQREIERMREMCDVLRAIAEQRTSERDEARREVCAFSFDDPRRTAEDRGWDCFKEPANAP